MVVVPISTAIKFFLLISASLKRPVSPNSFSAAFPSFLSATSTTIFSSASSSNSNTTSVKGQVLQASRICSRLSEASSRELTSPSRIFTLHLPQVPLPAHRAGTYTPFSCRASRMLCPSLLSISFFSLFFTVIFILISPLFFIWSSYIFSLKIFL